MEDYYNDLIAKCRDGKMDLEVKLVYIYNFLTWSSQQFKTVFRLAFPERPEEKLLLLTEKVANVNKTDGKIREY